MTETAPHHISVPARQTHRCSLEDLRRRIAAIDPRAYDRTRNYLQGQVTWLSPLLSHGITSTRAVADIVLERYPAKDCYRLLFELSWREYFHRTWQIAGNDIFRDLHHRQEKVVSEKLPAAIVNTNSGIQVIDAAVRQLGVHGLMHNHARLWVAGITCNLAQTHWLEPARWFHYQLLDGDLASNTLSWQWVAGTFSHKRYVANQENINRYSGSNQHGSWLDVPYEAFDDFALPAVLEERVTIDYAGLPESIKPIASLHSSLDGEVALRSLWNLDPRWRTDINSHLVFVDIELHERWPMNAHRWEFINYWASQCNATVVYGTVNELNDALADARVVRQEYTACDGWPGEIESRHWLYPLPESSFSSFSQFFKQVKRSVGL